MSDLDVRRAPPSMPNRSQTCVPRRPGPETTDADAHDDRRPQDEIHADNDRPTPTPNDAALLRVHGAPAPARVSLRARAALETVLAWDVHATLDPGVRARVFRHARRLPDLTPTQADMVVDLVTTHGLSARVLDGYLAAVPVEVAHLAFDYLREAGVDPEEVDPATGRPELPAEEVVAVATLAERAMEEGFGDAEHLADLIDALRRHFLNRDDVGPLRLEELEDRARDVPDLAALLGQSESGRAAGADAFAADDHDDDGRAPSGQGA